MSRSWAGGSTTAWRKLRLTILARDRHRCRIAYEGTWTTRTGRKQHCLRRADCVHHTHGKGITGDDPRYLIAACAPCNRRAGDPTRQADPRPQPRTRW